MSKKTFWVFLATCKLYFTKRPMNIFESANEDRLVSAQLHWLLLSQISISPQNLKIVSVDSVEKGNKGKSLFNEEQGIH